MSILQNMIDARWRGHRPLTWIAVAVAIGMFLVLAMGSLVTNTGAAYGCGHDWPLCNGKFVPAYNISSFIEYGHRMVSGLVGILVVVSTYGVTSLFRIRKDAMWYAWGTFFFTFLQAALGALAVAIRRNAEQAQLSFASTQQLKRLAPLVKM
ncbi:MAG: hypothetical protein A2189_07235 [Paenibacillus sp. RIFOXYA1_FULL_44_5]|nr:MAG: hypothetical protein A2189_07235 [Paenibacillus sp. RIFOXYA1_FULL_44_5]